jgi:hypothetical protein
MAHSELPTIVGEQRADTLVGASATTARKLKANAAFGQSEDALDLSRAGSDGGVSAEIEFALRGKLLGGSFFVHGFGGWDYKLS